MASAVAFYPPVMNTSSRWMLALAAVAFALLPAAMSAQSPSAPTESAYRPGTVSIVLEPFAEGLSLPVFVTSDGSGNGLLYAVEQVGTIRAIDTQGAASDAPLLDITDRVVVSYEQGLLGLAFHPGYADNGRLFVYYTRREDASQVVSEFRATGGIVDPDSERIILEMADFAENHNGGMLAFDADGMLLIGTGDGGGGGDPERNGQDNSQLLAKLLRIDVDGAEPYTTPVNDPDGLLGTDARPEIVATGLRNPWRYSVDRLTGDVFIGDVGQGEWEEVDVLARGQGGLNFGWNTTEGATCLEADDCDRVGLTLPVAVHPHSTGEGCTIIGGYVYRGTAFPSLTGAYLYGDYCSGNLWLLSANEAVAAGAATPEVVGRFQGSLSAFGQDDGGELYAVDIEGRYPARHSRRALMDPRACRQGRAASALRPYHSPVRRTISLAAVALLVASGCTLIPSVSPSPGASPAPGSPAASTAPATLAPVATPGTPTPRAVVTEPPVTAEPTPTPTTAPASTQPTVGPSTKPSAFKPSKVKLRLEPVADVGADAFPVYLTGDGTGEGRMYLVQRAGLIRIMNQKGKFQGTLLDLRGRVGTDGERGLHAVAFHPNFRKNGKFYVHYNTPAGNTRVVEYRQRKRGQEVSAGSGRTLLDFSRPEWNHNGGWLGFGPDGYLYIALGDGGGNSPGDPFGNGQDKNDLFGSILRVNVDKGSPYSIPKDNPFAKGGGRKELWNYGLRNPWRASFDRKTGDLWIGDVGQDQVEEVDVQREGKGGLNFGWGIDGGVALPQAGKLLDQGPHAAGERVPPWRQGMFRGRWLRVPR